MTASDDENTAPKRLIIGPSFGTEAAKITVIYKIVMVNSFVLLRNIFILSVKETQEMCY